MAEFTEIMTMQEKAQQEDRIVNGVDSKSSLYSSFIPTDFEGKKKMFNMLSEDGEPLMDNNNKEIGICDVVITPASVIDDKGSENVVPRIVISASDGKVYTAVSWGAYNSLSKINSIFGTLHFDDPLKVKVRVVKTKKGKTINFTVV